MDVFKGLKTEDEEKEPAKKKSPPAQGKSMTSEQTKLFDAVVEACNGDVEEMKKLLVKLTYYEKDGKIFNGKDSFYAISDAMAKVARNKLKKMLQVEEEGGAQ